MNEDEHALVRALGECASMFARITGDVVGDDLSEFVDKIHQCQAAVLSQAAARGYPDLYRALGLPGLSIRETADDTD